MKNTNHVFLFRSKMTERKRISRKNRKLPYSLMVIFMLLLAIMTSASIRASEKVYQAFMNSPFFVLKGMSVRGNNKVSTSDILNATGLDVGTDRICSLMSHIVEKRIKSYSPYVKQVEIKRDLTHGHLIITVKEREPVAIVAESRDAMLFKVVDINGFVLDKLISKNLASSPYRNMPLIFENGRQGRSCIGLSDSSGSYIVSESACLALNVLSEVRSILPSILDKISDIDARDPDDVIIYLKSGLNIRIASDRIKEGLLNVRYWMTNPEIQHSETDFSYIDARFPEAVYCG